MPATNAQRQALHAQRERWAAESLARAQRIPAGEARRIFRDEREKSKARNAAKNAELEQRCRDAIARADAAALIQRRGGRPKGKKNGKPKHGPGIFIPSRDKLDLLRASRPGGTV